MEMTVKNTSRQKLLMAVKAGDRLKVHEAKTNTIQTGNCVKAERKLRIS